MSLGNYLAEQILIEDTNITKVIAIYPGRFQPMGKHHAQVYKQLSSKFDEVWVATSGKVQIPKSPFSFAEKKKIIKSHGISKVMQVKSPYKAEEILKKLTIKRPDDPQIWYWLAEIQGLSKNIIGLHISRSEYFFLTGNYDQSIKHLRWALELSGNNFQLTESIYSNIEKVHEAKESLKEFS